MPKVSAIFADASLAENCCLINDPTPAPATTVDNAAERLVSLRERLRVSLEKFLRLFESPHAFTKLACPSE